MAHCQATHPPPPTPGSGEQAGADPTAEAPLQSRAAAPHGGYLDEDRRRRAEPERAGRTCAREAETTLGASWQVRSEESVGAVMLCARPGLQGIVLGPKPARACTRRHGPAIPRVDSHPRPRRHGRPRPRSHLCPHSHPPLAPSACTHARGSSEWRARGGGGGGGRGVGWRAAVAAQAAGGQGGVAPHATRNGEVCGGALGRGCRRLLRSLGLEGRLASDGSARHGTGAHRCALTRTRHAWVVRRLERGSTGHAAP